MPSHINLSCINIETFIIETRGIIASKNTFSNENWFYVYYIFIQK